MLDRSEIHRTKELPSRGDEELPRLLRAPDLDEDGWMEARGLARR